MEYTSINNNVATNNKEIINHYLKCFPDAPKTINFHVGYMLKVAYGNDLKKLSDRPVYYNVELHEEPIKEITIKDLTIK